MTMADLQSTHTILLIDDAPNDRSVAIRALPRQLPDLTVVEITNREQLEQVLHEGGFDAVITDFRLGWTNGFELLDLVKGRCPDCPVLMFSSTGTEEIAVKAMKAGLDDYVVKSVQNFDKLAEAVQRALERSTRNWTTVRCLLVDDDPVTLEGLCNLIEGCLFIAYVNVSCSHQHSLTLS